MKNSKSNQLLLKLIQSWIILVLVSCNAQEKTITLKVDTNALKGVEKVSVKGNIQPLSLTEEYLLTDANKDGVYEATITFTTSKPNLRFKFSVNGYPELEGDDARKIWFGKQPMTKEYVYNEFRYYNQDQLAKLTYTPSQIEEDLKILQKILPFVHPAVYKYRDSLTLQNDFKILEEELKRNPTISNAYGEVSKLAAKIKCSHTFTNPWNQGVNVKMALFNQPDKIPFTFNRIGKRLFIDKNASDNEALSKGLELVALNGVAIDEVLTNLMQYIASDGNNTEKQLERLLVTGEEKFAFFDIFYPIAYGSADVFSLTLKDLKTNQTFETKVKATSKTNRTKVLIERYGKIATSVREGWNFELIDAQTAKLSMKSFAVQRNEFDWKAYLNDVFEQLENKSITNFIIDIRGNEGGQGEVGEYILERVIQKPLKIQDMQSTVSYLKIPEEFKKYIKTWDKFPYSFKGKYTEKRDGVYVLKSKYSVKEKVYKPLKNGYKGKVFLLTDASNSSATHLMAAYAKQAEEITIVGQETGGNQLGTNGSFMFFLRLLNTFVELDIPVINMYVPVGTTPKDGGIQPDVSVIRKATDFINNKDVELAKVLEIIKEQ
ncbi:S41 family peptidase [Ascidiimonas sp. W6]|uniref:S41 family peptidase n=1 Tax=Ascidiimonas meishanensis TaxID=3128903 RepID=UPI0030EEFB64